MKNSQIGYVEDVRKNTKCISHEKLNLYNEILHELDLLTFTLFVDEFSSREKFTNRRMHCIIFEKT